MRAFNTIMILVFGLMAVALAAAGFKNNIHFVFSAISAALAWLAYADRGGFRIRQKVKQKVRVQ